MKGGLEGTCRYWHGYEVVTRDSCFSTHPLLTPQSSGAAGGYLLPLLSSQSFILDSNSWLSPLILDHPQRPIVADVPLLLFPQTLWGNYYQQANIVPEGIIRGGTGWGVWYGVVCMWREGAGDRYCSTILSYHTLQPLMGIVNVSMSYKLIFNSEKSLQLNPINWFLIYVFPTCSTHILSVNSQHPFLGYSFAGLGWWVADSMFPRFSSVFEHVAIKCVNSPFSMIITCLPFDCFSHLHQLGKMASCLSIDQYSPIIKIG